MNMLYVNYLNFKKLKNNIHNNRKIKTVYSKDGKWVVPLPLHFVKVAKLSHWLVKNDKRYTCPQTKSIHNFAAIQPRDVLKAL